MIYVLYVLHIVVSLFLILVVLLQQGKGADLSVFGGGSTQTAFGARGAATVLHKLTVGCFIAFIVTTVGIAAFQGTGDGGGSVIGDDLDVPAAAETVPAEEPAPTEAEPAEANEVQGEADTAPPASDAPASGDAADGGEPVEQQ